MADERPLASARRRSRWLPIGAVAAAVVIAGTAACSTSGDQSSPQAPAAAADPDLGLPAGQYLYVGNRSDGIGNAWGDVA